VGLAPHANALALAVAMLGCGGKPRANDARDQQPPSPNAAPAAADVEHHAPLDHDDWAHALNFTRIGDGRGTEDGVSECFGARVAVDGPGERSERRDRAKDAAKALILEIVTAAHHAPTRRVPIADVAKYVAEVAGGAPMRAKFPNDGGQLDDTLVISALVCKWADASPVGRCLFSGGANDVRWEIEWVDLDGKIVTEARCRPLGGTWSRAR
jgi:hypothetical protein